MCAWTQWLHDNVHFGATRLGAASGIPRKTLSDDLARMGLNVRLARSEKGLPEYNVPTGDIPKAPARSVSTANATGDTAGAERVDVRHTPNGVTAEIIIQTPQGATLPLDEALANPKFTRALQAAELDLNEFEIERFVANSWDVTLKTDTGAETRTNHQFKVTWRRKTPSPLAIAMERLLERVKPAPPRKAKAVSGERMVEVALYDMHFGLLTWKAETGEDYDTDIASSILTDAVAQTINRTAALKPEYYLVPIGNDLFHVNDQSNSTPQNKNRLDVDTRLARIIEVVERTLEAMVDAMAKVAPVRLLWVPGNHDPQTSYWLLRVLAARYRDDERVDVDTSPMPRKYHLYGKNLVGFMHGDEIGKSNEKGLAGLMADEAAHLWAPDQYREIHRAHTHRKGELCFMGAETYGSVVVRNIPSLTGTDYWHFGKGFVETSKTAQYFVWNRHYGLESVNDVHVDSALYHKKQPACEED